MNQKDKVAIIDGITGDRRTYGDLVRDTHSIGGCLQKDHGVSQGDIVGIISPNHVDYFACLHGTAMLGGAITPMNPVYTSSEVGKQLCGSQAKVLISHPDCLEVAHKAKEMAKEECNLDVQVLDLHSDIGKMKARMQGVVLNPTPASHDDTVVLPYSSGTTGLPKGVELTHENMVSNTLQSWDCENRFVSSDDVILSPLPIFHIYAFLASLHNTLYRGATLVTMKSFDLERFCQLVQEHKCTRMHVVPPILLALAKSPIVDNFDFSSMKIAISAAAPLGAELEVAVSSRLNIKVKQLWGMSELSPLGTGVPDDRLKVGSGTVGPPCASSSVKVVNLNTGEALPAGEEGELVIKGPQVMKGYLNAPDKTKECLNLETGWFQTGDIAKIDQDGYVYITDRLKELIKVKGFQVAPAELEALLYTHPNIADSCVIPVDDERSGQVPLAYVVLKSGDTKTTAEEICEFVSERAAYYKRLAGGVRFVSYIPKTASGKILRRVVMEDHKDSLKHS